MKPKSSSLNEESRSRSLPVAAADVPDTAPAADTALAAASERAPLFTRRALLVAAALSLVALLLLLSLQSTLGIAATGVSKEPYFNAQAESWLHGRWDVQIPVTSPDIETINGKQYLYYPPFPALLLLPFVALFGVSASDILFTTVLSAANMGLLFLLFEQLRLSGLSKRSWSEHALIAVFCFFGTITLVLSLGGTVWFTAHIVCMTCTLLALLLALRGRYGWGAVLLGCAFFCRFPVALGFLFLFYLAWEDAGRQPRLRRFLASLRAARPDWGAVPWRRLLPIGVALVVLAALFAAHNLVVFGSPLETGYAALLQQRYPQVQDGVLSLSYVPANLINLFFNFPYVTFGDLFHRQMQIDLLNKGSGISVFVTTPLFLFLFWRNRRFSPLRAVLWVVVGLDVLTLLLFYNAGGYQFGVRYLYDVYPFAFVLLILNEWQVDWRVALLGVFGISINLLGALEFWTLFPRLG